MGRRDDEFWANFLGVRATDWNVPGLSIRAHAGLAGYVGVWIFRCREHTVVSAPGDWVAPLERKLDERDAERLFDESFVKDVFGDDFDRVSGAAFQGSLDPQRFRHVDASQVRPVGRDELERLCAACRSAGVDDSGIHKAGDYLMGYVEGGTLAAAAGYRSWSDHAGDPCILAHPDFYGRGYGTAVTSAVVQRALQAGKLLLYQTLEANRGAVRIALKLGYEQHARHLAVRLRPRLQ
jgi:GNAT superfamily N-acetyltransferase